MLANWVGNLVRLAPNRTESVREVRDEYELRSLREAWEALHPVTAGADFFRSWNWFETYWRHFGVGQQLRVLVVGDDGGLPQGIVPLTLRVEPSRIGPVRRIGFPLDNWGAHYGPLGAHTAETLAATLRYLCQQRRDWDVIDLRWVPAELCPEVVRGWRQAGVRFHQKLWSRTSGIDLSPGWEAFWNQRASKWRNNQRRGDKLLARMGAIEVVHFRPPRGAADPRWDLYDLCENVAGDSWQGACSFGNTLSHPTVRAFLRDLHAIAVLAGAVHLSLLLVQGRPAAFTYNYHCRGTTFGLRTGYQREFQAAGPGAVLMRETIRECCRIGDRWFHLGESPSEYKRHLANCAFETFQFCHFSPTSPRGLALRIKSWL